MLLEFVGICAWHHPTEKGFVSICQDAIATPHIVKIYKSTKESYRKKKKKVVT